MARVLLVNTNTMKPPVSPVGLDYVASALEASGHEVALADLAFAPQDGIKSELAGAIERSTPDVVGLTVRNTDDCCLATRDFLLPRIARWLAAVREHCDVPIVLGGIGFSVMPAETFAYLGADYGLAGDGEETFPRLVEALGSGADTRELPGLVWAESGGDVAFNPPSPADAAQWPLPARRHVDNARYLREGAMVGIETKRGCTGTCVYCADPVAKGSRYRLRPPRTVVEEIRGLLDQGADVYHTCDSEFNMPGEHGQAVCEAIVEAGLGDRIRWYAYCAPVPFHEETARLYRQAGCCGINFGADSGSDAMLLRLGRDYQRDDIADAVAATKAAGMSCMVDLLMGGPGESIDTLRETIEFARSVGADRVGLSVGVRVYPRTPMARELFGGTGSWPRRRGTDQTQPDLLQPYFWIEPALGNAIHAIIRELVANDPRFLFMDPAQMDANYNYSDNTVLVEAIRQGHRGAFWDILRRVAEHEHPV